jgi:hypothetical protein
VAREIGIRDHDAASHDDDMWWASYYTGNKWKKKGMRAREKPQGREGRKGKTKAISSLFSCAPRVLAVFLIFC